jgi:hypothetical protein
MRSCPSMQNREQDREITPSILLGHGPSAHVSGEAGLLTVDRRHYGDPVRCMLTRVSIPPSGFTSLTNRLRQEKRAHARHLLRLYKGLERVSNERAGGYPISVQGTRSNGPAKSVYTRRTPGFPAAWNSEIKRVNRHRPHELREDALISAVSSPLANVRRSPNWPAVRTIGRTNVAHCRTAVFPSVEKSVPRELQACDRRMDLRHILRTSPVQYHQLCGCLLLSEIAMVLPFESLLAIKSTW